MERRREHVRLLAIFHFVYAGAVLLGTLVPIVWLSLATVWWPELADEARHSADGRPALAAGTLGLAMASIGIMMAWVWALVLVFAGRSLLARQRYTFCMVVAGLTCLSIPLGTVLGVTTLMILNQEETRRLFAVDPS